MSNTMSGGQAVIATLVANNIDTIFGIPGVPTLPIYDAIRQSAVRHVLARHEQGAGFMAEGYPRAAGRIGVACVITGPGVTNVATPMASAFSDSVPLLVIASSVQQSSDPRLKGLLHEIKDQLGVMKSLAGFATKVTNCKDIPDVINSAVSYLTSSRPRGAYIEVPQDLLKEHAEFTVLPARPASPASPDQESVERAVALLRDAQRPLILAGAGVTAANANNELIELAELLSAPVVLGAKSHDAMPSDHPLAIPTTYELQGSVIDLAAKADVALVIGSKLGAERTDYGALGLPSRLVHVDIDEIEIGRDYPVEVPIIADAGETLRALLRGLEGHASSYDGTRDAAVPRAARVQHATAMFGDNVRYITALDAALPDDVIVSADMTSLGYASAEVLSSRYARTFLHSSELCAIGCGLPTALGAKAAHPSRPVIAICGDGGFLLNPGELATAVQEHLPVVIVVFNDHSFEAVKTEQLHQYGEAIATDLVGPDYVALARSFGANGVLASTPDELRAAVQSAFATADQTTLIEVAL